MIVCKFNEVKNEIITQLRERSLIPILGSGFTRGADAHFGKVPSGDDMQLKMVELINLAKPDLPADWQKKHDFQKISLYFHNYVNKDIIKKYVLSNFTDVKLDELRKKLLEIEWIYIYTLNIDDGIEKNSLFNNIISSNRQVDFSILAGKKCVIKLHGDANDYLKYNDDESQIFNYKQYANSLENNKSLLDKIRTDYSSNNLIFIGCSLENEFDLLTLDKFKTSKSEHLSSIYYFTTSIPDELKMIDLKEYGVSHIVLNDSYDSIYENIIWAYNDSKKIKLDDTDSYKNLKINLCPIGSAANSKFFFYGKQLLCREENSIILPEFFIERELLSRVLRNISQNAIHMVHGRRVSGKTYFLASICKAIRNKDVYYFDSISIAPRDVISSLLEKNNIVILFDTGSITKDLIFELLNMHSVVKKNGNNIIININTSDKDIISMICNNANSQYIKNYHIRSIFTKQECSKLNEHLAHCVLPKFNDSKTILDNLIEAETNLEKRNYSKISIRKNTVQEVMVLIILAIKEKIYFSELIKYDIFEECIAQQLSTEPLISREYTLAFERNIDNSSQNKYVLNAKYWLFNELGKLSKTVYGQSLIVEAYYKIIEVILKTKTIKYNNLIQDYIKFDVINEIFITKNKGQISLIKKIYEKLNFLLSNNPHYLHQRAKCYLWQSNYDLSYIEQLREALTYSMTALHNLKIDFSKNKNDKINISISHIKFTIALISCRICIIKEYNVKDLSKSISAIFEAIQEENNVFDFLNMKHARKGKIDDIENVKNYALRNKDSLSDETRKELQTILKIIFEMHAI